MTAERSLVQSIINDLKTLLTIIEAPPGLRIQNPHTAVTDLLAAWGNVLDGLIKEEEHELD